MFMSIASHLPELFIISPTPARHFPHAKVEFFSSLTAGICNLCGINIYNLMFFCVVRHQNSISPHLSVISGLSNGAIRSIRLVVEPAGVRRGQSATLKCLYDLDGAPLLSLQFYRGSGEFYRYSPTTAPTKKVFPLSGINVDVSEAGRVVVKPRNPLERHCSALKPF